MNQKLYWVVQIQARQILHQSLQRMMAPVNTLLNQSLVVPILPQQIMMLRRRRMMVLVSMTLSLLTSATTYSVMHARLGGSPCLQWKVIVAQAVKILTRVIKIMMLTQVTNHR